MVRNGARTLKSALDIKSLIGADEKIEVSSLSGTVLARLKSARLLLSLPCAHVKGMRRTGSSMFDLKRKLLAVVTGCLLSAGAFAQKHDGDKRPPKDDNRVVVQPKGEKPPPSNNNQGDKKGNEKRGKP
ncbi:MAG TPA: hypothetical protein DCK93_13270 [Blastocatellia bacterium]|nr:hypothetical protein [Blastocatellia bacterium]